MAMLVAALGSALHVLGISAAFAFSVARLIALHHKDEAATRFADNGNGLAALLMYGSGLWRLFGELEKPLAFYTGSSLFWIKMGLLLVATGLEVYPQVVVLPWHFRKAAGKPIEPRPGQFERMFRLAALQLPCLMGVVVCAALMARGVGQPPPEVPVPAAAAPVDLTAGQQVYEKYCQACHQPDGRGVQGAVAADFVGNPSFLAKPDDQLLRSIAQGITGPRVMPPWGTVLTPEQQIHVLGYIRARFGGARSPGGN